MIDAGGSLGGNNRLNPLATVVGLVTVVVSLHGLALSC